MQWVPWPVCMHVHLTLFFFSSLLLLFHFIACTLLNVNVTYKNNTSFTILFGDFSFPHFFLSLPIYSFVFSCCFYFTTPTRTTDFCFLFFSLPLFLCFFYSSFLLSFAVTVNDLHATEILFNLLAFHSYQSFPGHVDTFFSQTQGKVERKKESLNSPVCFFLHSSLTPTTDADTDSLFALCTGLLCLFPLLLLLQVSVCAGVSSLFFIPLLAPLQLIALSMSHSLR